MSFNRLLLLHPTLVESVASSTIGSNLPVKPMKQSVPIKPTHSWIEKDGSLYKEYKFDSIENRNRFIHNLLSYEEEKGHNAKIVISNLKVGVKVSTKSVNKVTELDKEYARSLDLIEKEVRS